ncbi:MAG: hypothetical protein R3C18_08330 [Planctomycetaceae bacterium]
MASSAATDSFPTWFSTLVSAYLIGAIPWGLFEMSMWLQPGVPYGFGDVVFFTLLWPLRLLMWVTLG